MGAARTQRIHNESPAHIQAHKNSAHTYPHVHIYTSPTQIAVAMSSLGPTLWSASPLTENGPSRYDVKASTYLKHNRVNIHGPTFWRPRAGLGISSNKCEHVAGAPEVAPCNHTASANKHTVYLLQRLGGRALALADRSRYASMSLARDAPRARSPILQAATHASRTASAKNGVGSGSYVWAAARWP